MEQNLVWHPKVHTVLTETLHIFAIEAYSYTHVFDELQKTFEDLEYKHPVYLTYGMFDIFMFFWLNAEQYPKTEEIITLSLSGDGGTFNHMAVDDIYYHCGHKIPKNRKIPIIADYNLGELDQLQKDLTNSPKFDDFLIGKAKPPRKIEAFITITHYETKIDKRERSKIINAIQRIFTNSSLSDNLYGLYSGSDMCDILLEVQTDDFETLSLIAENMQPISLTRAKISTYILAKPIVLRNNFCHFKDQELSIDGLKGILVQKFPKLNALGASSQIKMLDTYRNFKPWFGKVNNFIQALINEDVEESAKEFIAIATKFENSLRTFIKKYAVNKWGSEYMKELLSIHPKQQQAKDKDYKDWTLGLLAYSLQSLNNIENWITQEQVSLIHDFVKNRNKIAHVGSSSISIPLQEKTLLNFFKVTDHLPKELQIF